MTEINKLLWMFLIVSLNGLISIAIKRINNEKVLIILGALFVLILLIINSCWVFMDFWK